MKKHSLAGVMFENLTTNAAVCQSAFVNMEPRVCLHTEPRAWLQALVLMIHISHFISEKEARQRHNPLPPPGHSAAPTTLPTSALPSRRLAEQMRLPGYLKQAGPRIILTFPPKSLGQTTFSCLGVMERKTAQKAVVSNGHDDVIDACCCLFILVTRLEAVSLRSNTFRNVDVDHELLFIFYQFVCKYPLCCNQNIAGYSKVLYMTPNKEYFFTVQK